MVDRTESNLSCQILVLSRETGQIGRLNSKVQRSEVQSSMRRRELIQSKYLPEVQSSMRRRGWGTSTELRLLIYMRKHSHNESETQPQCESWYSHNES